ncbi:hypothetical protein RAF91_27545, partial [Klebsiella pneumoniae]
MATPVISGNDVFSHVFIGASDVEKSADFYDAVLGTLGINNLGPFGNGWVLYGVVSENGIYGHSRFCNTDFDDKLACLNLSG